MVVLRRAGLLIAAAAIAITASLVLSSTPNESGVQTANARRIGGHKLSGSVEPMKRIVDQALDAPADSGAPKVAQTSGAGSPTVLTRPSPKWYTEDLHREVLDAGSRGVDVSLEPHDPALMSAEDCVGITPNDGVSAGACMVYPSGCTMNFIFADTSGAKYIGTAGHCVHFVGQEVVIQVRSGLDLGGTLTTVAKIGNVTKFVNAGIGSDFGIVKIDPGFAISPAIPVAGPAGLGPTGVFCGSNTGAPVRHYGHGYHFLVEQGYPRAGAVVNSQTPFPFGPNGYNWAGFGLGGDSGSPVIHAADSRAIGNLTHGIATLGGLVPIPGLSYGMRMQAIMEFLGSGFRLVNGDGSYSSGCAGTVVNQPPTASFTVTFPGKNGGSTGNFDASGSSDPDGSIVSYVWNFGDGTTGSGVQVSHAYSAEGAYTATLTVTDNGGATSSASKNISCTRSGKNIRCKAQ